MISKGYIGIFEEPIQRKTMVEMLQNWLDRFERVEQLIPGDNQGTSALTIKKTEELMWHSSMEFRIIQGEDFAWAYVTPESKIIETSGLPAEQISICLDLLLELPGLTEVIDEHDEKRLEQLEKEGLIR